MTNTQQHAFYSAAGFHAAMLNTWLRLTAGLLLVVVAVIIVVGLLACLEDGTYSQRLRFIMYLMTLAIVLTLFFSFVAA